MHMNTTQICIGKHWEPRFVISKVNAYICIVELIELYLHCGVNFRKLIGFIQIDFAPINAETMPQQGLL